MRLSKFQLAILALIAANVIWGAAPPIFKWSLSDIGPYTLAFLRFAVPVILLLPIIKGKLFIHPKDRIKLFFAGIFGITINIIFFFQGLLHAPSINAALIISSAPIFIVLFSFFFLREKPKKKLITGSLIGLIGVVFVLIMPFIRDGNVDPFGNFYYVIAMISSVVAIFLVRSIMKRNNALSVTFWSFAIGSIGFIPFFLDEVSTIGFLQDIGIEGYAGIIFGILLSSLAAYFLHTYALKYLTAADVGIFTYIDPVVTLLVAAPLLGEFPDTVFIVGSVLIIYGIFHAEGRLHWHPIHLIFQYRQPKK